MNAPVHVDQNFEEVINAARSMREIDRKRYLWMISPALPVIGIGILAGYQFSPRPIKKIFALGGPIVLHIIIPVIDTIIGKDASNPTSEEIKQLENDPYYARLVKSFIPLQYIANVYAC